MFPFIISSASNHAVPNTPTFQTNLLQQKTWLGIILYRAHQAKLLHGSVCDYQSTDEVGKLYSTGVRAEKVIWSEQLHNRRYEIAIITSSASTSSFEEDDDDDDDDDDEYVCNIK
uniref:Uncharacterized protein n=1 Tax=Glossina austeni TaxID=7395 RepID=A0A1A9UEW0_GLOAU